MSSFGGGWGQSTPTVGERNQIPNPNGDVIVNDPPTDTISSVAWSPTGNNFACGSWSNEVRVWSLQGRSTSSATLMQHDAPVLDICWSLDGQNIFSVSCDKTVRMWNPSARPRTIGVHDAPIKCVAHCPENNAVISAGWDRQLKYWDPRNVTGKPLGQIQLPERAYAMDLCSPMLVVATATRKIQIYDVRNPNKPLKDMESTLKYQSRCVACFPDRTGFAVGSIEGRVSIQHVERSLESKNFAFKCHRQNQDIYAVNCISFNHKYGTFATAGSDGTFNFWDKDLKQRLRGFESLKIPITATGFNADGNVFAYATSYDWSQGSQGYKPNEQKPQIYLRQVSSKEIQKRHHS